MNYHDDCSKELKRVVKNVAAGNFLFLIGTYALSFLPGFTETLIKGSVLSAIVIPPVYFHYSDEDRY